MVHNLVNNSESKYIFAIMPPPHLVMPLSFEEKYLTLYTVYQNMWQEGI